MTAGDRPFDPYKTLQVDPEAEEEVIEAAYRRLARKYHPDVAPGPESQARMVAFNRAWELLRDPARRAKVDRARAAAAARASTMAQAGGSAPAAPQATRDPARDMRQGSAEDRRPPQAGAAPGWQSTPGWQSPARPERSADPAPGFGAYTAQTNDPVGANWSAGRSWSGSGYDPSRMRTADGSGAAGAPPGSPSGSTLKFGRYEGWSIGEIVRVDPEYLEWLDRMPIGRPFQGEIDAALRALGRRSGGPGRRR